MRKGWTETTLGELVKIQKGKKPPALDVREEASHPYLTADVLRGATCEQFVSFALTGLCIQLSGRETVLLWDGAGAGDVFKSQPGILASTMAKLEARDSLDMDDGYLYLYLNFKQVAIKSSCRGTTVPHVSPEALKALYVSLPPLAEQKRIVDVVSSVDSYIDALQQQAGTARTARNAVLHELLSAGGDGWTETTLGGVAVFYNGKAYKQDELLAAGKYRVLRVGNFFSNGSWYWSDLELDANKYCDNGDLLYAWSASFGPRIWTDEKVIYHYHIWKIEENPLLVEKKFLYYWLEDDVQRMKRDAGTGSIMMHITKGEIEARAIALPPLVEQRRIVEIVSSMDEVIQSTEQAVVDAKNLRSGLLSDLLSGEHEIPESYDRLLGAA